MHEPLVVIIGQLGFAHDGEQLYVRMLAGRKERRTWAEELAARFACVARRKQQLRLEA